MTVQLVSEPQIAGLDGARAGVLATRLAELMGIFERPAGVRIDRALVGSVIRAAADAGLADQVAVRSDAREPGKETTIAFLDALQNSPRPSEETGRLAAIFGYPQLGHLVGASEPSLRRYAAGERQPADAIAQRIHFLALLVAIIRGSFNEFGIRRWFERPHPALGGRVPADLLSTAIDPADPDARAIFAAAAHLLW